MIAIIISMIANIRLLSSWKPIWSIPAKLVILEIGWHYFCWGFHVDVFWLFCHGEIEMFLSWVVLVLELGWEFSGSWVYGLSLDVVLYYHVLLDWEDISFPSLRLLDVHITASIVLLSYFLHISTGHFFFGFDLFIIIISANINFNGVLVCSRQHHLPSCLLFPSEWSSFPWIFQLFHPVCVSERIHWVLSRTDIGRYVSNHYSLAKAHKWIL